MFHRHKGACHCAACPGGRVGHLLCWCGSDTHHRHMASPLRRTNTFLLLHLQSLFQMIISKCTPVLLSTFMIPVCLVM